jgi:hypothetical protein
MPSVVRYVHYFMNLKLRRLRQKDRKFKLSLEKNQCIHTEYIWTFLLSLFAKQGGMTTISMAFPLY